MIKNIIASGERLDKEISSQDISRSKAAKLIEKGLVKVNGVVVNKVSYKTQLGDNIVLKLPEEKSESIKPEDIPLDIIYEDEFLAVINKPYGQVVHPAAGHNTGTLVNALMYKFQNLSNIGGEERPGIVHRLDKDTSGIIMIAKDNLTHQFLSKEIKNRNVSKRYFAMVEGSFNEQEGFIDKPIARSPKDRKKMAVVVGGREALTEWKVVREFPDKTLLDINLITGRTHQIRVHMSSIHHPVLGDAIYRNKSSKRADRLMLHSWYLSFLHPKLNKRLAFICKPESSFLVPEDYYKTANDLSIKT
ncbi:MAG: RluA family pseudouridine synthase [Eubacteriales bacterium]|nr:RluA family pseudouridine synthase [Eubacteriales bacterium]